MSIAVSKRLVMLPLAVMLMILVLKAGAIRLLSEDVVVNEKKDVVVVVEEMNVINNNKNNKRDKEEIVKKEEMLKKYFNGRSYNGFNSTGKGIEESKRRVPSCPDPLHNK
ncbi:hypothetical protein IFM89_013431 [Coptis chinensis]|uniref:CLAVATA3/ESR (CLE)-related protein n=1 Tax=Coptis chinensis TaxID=261450 RepID=A0A835LE84_9MAGN|nr:hypothetical protein IFM89_013431 [Coptis chinensis]